MNRALDPSEYDLEPVVYCSKCYSLKIKYIDTVDSDCCMDCGCSDTLTTDIHTWEKLYEERYGHKFVEKSNDPRKTYIFRVPLEEVKRRTYKHPLLKEIIHKLYPRFPEGLTKEESVLMLFDKLAKDNRLDELKFLLLQYS